MERLSGGSLAGSLILYGERATDGETGLPTLSRKLAAKNVDIPVWTPRELGLSENEAGLAGSPTRVVQVFRPRLTRDAVIHRHGSDGVAVSGLVEFLRERKFI